MPTYQETHLEYYCKAFTRETAREYTVLVTAAGDVLAWDSVAGHFTRAHVMSAESVAECRRRAEAVVYA
jgi:hypothetical protein